MGKFASGLGQGMMIKRAQKDRDADREERAADRDLRRRELETYGASTPPFFPEEGGGGRGVSGAWRGGGGGGEGGGAPIRPSMSQQEFIDMMMPHAMRVSEATGVDPRIVIAQSAQETGWGKSAPGNNFFGVKSHGRDGGKVSRTHEYVGGQRLNGSDSFRTYSDVGTSADDYGAFLNSNPRYKPMLEAQGLDAQVDALAASGYATDPNYGSAIRSIASGITIPRATAAAAPAPTAAAAPEPAAATPENWGVLKRLMTS